MWGMFTFVATADEAQTLKRRLCGFLLLCVDVVRRYSNHRLQCLNQRKNMITKKQESAASLHCGKSLPHRARLS